MIEQCKICFGVNECLVKANPGGKEKGLSLHEQRESVSNADGGGNTRMIEQCKIALE